MNHDKEELAANFSRWMRRLVVSPQKLVTFPLCRFVALMLSVIFLFSCGETQPSGPLPDAIVEAEKHFVRTETSAADREQLLGMSEVKVFGRGKYLGHTFVGKPTAWKAKDTPEVFEVTIPFWCSGKDSAGRFQKLSRELRVRVSRDAGSQWKIENHELGAIRPLSFGDQFRPWIKWVLLSYLLLVPICLLTFAIGESWPSTILGIIGAGMALYAAFGSSLACFGGGVALMGGVFGYIAGLTIIVILVLVMLR